MLNSALASILLSLAAQQPADGVSKDGNTVVDNASGVLMARPPFSPPADNPWGCYDKGQIWFGENTKCCVSRKMEQFSIEVLVQRPEQGKKYPELDELGKQIISSYDENKKPKDGKEAPWQEIKYVKKTAKNSKFTWRNKGCFEIEATVTRTDGTVLELHEWIFMEVDALVRVVCVGAPGEYKSRLNDVNKIMPGIKIRSGTKWK